MVGGVSNGMYACVHRCLVLLDRSEGEAGLRKLGRVLYEAAGQSYLDAARRRLSLHAERRIQTPELSARVAFKARYSKFVYIPSDRNLSHKYSRHACCTLLH